MRRGSVFGRVLLVCMLLVSILSLPLNLVERVEGISVGPAVIDTNTTWTLANSPYWIEGNVILANGATLTIEPGVQVLFNGFYILYIDGSLIAVGLETSRINITSNMTSPTPGDWNKIQINATGHVEMVYSNISYSKFGINLDSSSNNNLSHCNISNNEGNGLDLYLSSNNSIVGNVIYNNGAHGINLLGSSFNKIIENNIIYNDHDGIHLDQSLNNNITNNSISFNSDSGIVFWTSGNHNVITRNNVSVNNWIGIYLVGSSMNYIFHNRIINNFIQAADDSTNNFWNNTYPSGGNYWSDHSLTCTDDFSGPITPQTTGSPDGICDVQRDLDSDSIDYYPLKYPAGVDLTPPVVMDMQPPIESISNKKYPEISANFFDVSGIDVSSVVLRVDNIIVPATITANNVTYMPTIPLSDGLHNITLEVRDASPNHNLATASWNFTIDSTPPVALAGVDKEIAAGKTMMFNGSMSYDNVSAIVSYKWTFVYDGEMLMLYGAHPFFTFDIVGEYEVTLTVEDSAGNNATDTMWVSVVSDEPYPSALTFFLPLLAATIPFIVLLIVLLLRNRRRSRKEVNSPEEKSPPEKEI